MIDSYWATQLGYVFFSVAKDHGRSSDFILATKHQMKRPTREVSHGP